MQEGSSDNKNSNRNKTIPRWERIWTEWFDQSCKPEQAVEPSLSERASRDDDQDTATSEELFVPVKSGHKILNKKEYIDSTTLEVLNVVKDIVKNDPTKELIGFMREEMEDSRKQEMQLFQLMLNSNSNSNVGNNNCYQ